MKKVFLIVLVLCSIKKMHAQTGVSQEKEGLLYVEVLRDMAKLELERINPKTAILPVPQISTRHLDYFKLFVKENGLKSFDQKNEWDFISDIDSLRLSKNKSFNFQTIKTPLALNRIRLKKKTSMQLIFTPFIYSMDGSKATYISGGFYKISESTSEPAGLAIFFYEYYNNGWRLKHSEPLTLY